MTIKFELATNKDLSKIVEIYNEAIPTHQSTADLEPITIDDRIDWFNSFDDTHPIWLIKANDETVGWVALEQMYGRAAYQKSAEIAIYLSPNGQGKGIGPQAIQFLKDQAKELGLKAIAAYVLSQNLPSRKMFERSGFAEWGHLPKVCIFDDIERDIYIYGYHPND